MMYIPATSYYSFYLILISILTFFCIFKYSYLSPDRIGKSLRLNYIPSIILISFLILFIGLRPLSGTFIDMMNYNEAFNAVQSNSRGFEYNNDTDNFIFDNLLSYIANNYYEIIVFFFIIAFIYFICMFWALKLIFPNDLFYALVIYLGALSTFSYATNGIKAGAAASLFLLVFAFYRKPILIVLFGIISLGFHHSMVLPILGFAFAYFIRNPKWFFMGWIFCLFLSFFHINAITEFLANFVDDKGQSYLLGDEIGWGGKTGFRWDFVLYSLIPILIGIWAIYRHRVIDRLYQLLLCTYLAVNGIWMLCMYVPFNNRIAYLSWFMLPVVSIYPFIKLKTGTRQYIQLNYVASFFLAFTLLTYFFL